MSLRDRLMGRRPDPAAPAVGNGNGAGGLPGSDLGGATVAGGNGAGLYSPVGGAPLPPPRADRISPFPVAPCACRACTRGRTRRRRS